MQIGTDLRHILKGLIYIKRYTFFNKNCTSIALNHRVGLYIYGLYLEMVAPIVK